MDTPIMSRCEHLDHDLWTTPSAANVNDAPRKDALTPETAMAYARDFFTHYDMENWVVTEAAWSKHDTGIMNVYCTWVCKEGGNYRMDVWLDDNGKLYGEL